LASSNLKLFFKNSNKVILSFSFGLISVLIASFFATLIFKGKIKEVEIITAMMVGCYSGGVANMASIGEALNVSTEIFGILSLYDVILGGAYLLFVFTIAQRVFTLVLPRYKFLEDIKEDDDLENSTFSKLDLKKKSVEVIKSLVLGIILTAISVGISFLYFGSINAPTIIISLTFMGTLVSLIPSINKMKANFQTGDFLLLSFGLAMGILSDFSNFSLESINIFVFMALILYGSLIIHLFFAKLFKIDTDTFIITSSAAIMSPPFIPAIAASIKNRQIILAGLSTGIMGMALGNLLGILMYQILILL
jgi:uncharacterized membrane protein